MQKRSGVLEFKATQLGGFSLSFLMETHDSHILNQSLKCFRPGQVTKRCGGFVGSSRFKS